MELKAWAIPGIVTVAKQERSGKSTVNPAAQTHRLNGQQDVLDEEVCLYMNAEGAHEAQRNGEIFIQKSALHPLFHTGKSVKVPIIYERWPVSIFLRQQIHHAVNILLCHIDNRHQHCAARNIRNVTVPADIAWKMPGEIQPMV